MALTVSAHRWASLGCVARILLCIMMHGSLSSALRPTHVDGDGHTNGPVERALRGAPVQAAVQELPVALVGMPMQLAGARAKEGATMLNTMCGSYNKIFKKKKDVAGVLKVCDSLPLANMCEWDASLCDGNLNFSRCEMPQLPLPEEDSENWEAWVAANADAGIDVAAVNISIGKLVKYKPSQMFVDLCKVCSIAYTGSLCFKGGTMPTAEMCEEETDGCFCSWTSGISVSEDGYILDGHHRWAAANVLLEDGLLKNGTQAAVESYEKKKGTAAIKLINKTAAAHPELVEYTDCADEVVDQSGTMRAACSGLVLTWLPLAFLISVKP